MHVPPPDSDAASAAAAAAAADPASRTDAADAAARARILDRIRKLMAFNHATATEAEVENAMGLAARLMEAHAIEQDEVEAALRTSADDAAAASHVERDLRRGDAVASMSWWEKILASAVREAVPGVGSYIERKRRRTRRGGTSSRSHLVWYGPVAAVEVAELLYEETRLVIASMATFQYGGCFRGEGRSYAEGFAESLYAAAREARAASEQQERVSAIVLRTEAANERWLADRHGVRPRASTSAAPSGEHHDGAFLHGTRDGQAHEFGGIRPRLDEEA